MNDLTFLTNYAVPIIVGTCLCVGYVLKNIIVTDKVDRFIPLIMAILGIFLNIWINMSLTPEILLAGMFSGLASTGLHQAFKQIISEQK
jgi:hypothetical protein